MRRTIHATLVVLGMFMAVSLARAVTYTFTPNVFSNYDWAATTNWSGGVTPFAANDAKVAFFTDTLTPLTGSGVFYITNGDPAALTLNTLDLNGVSPSAAGTYALRIGTIGNTWTFDDPSPTVNLNSRNYNSGSVFNPFLIHPNLVLNQNLTFAGSGTASSFLFGGVIADGVNGSKGITKNGTAALTLTNASTFTGGITINGGTLLEDFSSLGTPVNLLNSANALTLGGGTFGFKGRNGAVTSQTFASTTLKGGTIVALTRNSATSLTVALGTIARYTGGTLNFTTVPDTSMTIVTTSTANDATGILGPWLAVGATTTLQYGTTNGSGQIVSYTGATTTAQPASLSDVTSATGNYAFGATTTPSLTGPIIAHTLRYTGASTGYLTNGGNAITLDGLMNATANNKLTIMGAGNLVIGANRELVIFSPGAQLAIACPIVDNPAGASALTLNFQSSGQSDFTSDSSYSGGTTVNSGTVRARAALAFGTGPVTVNTGAEIQLGFGFSLTNALTLNGGSKLSFQQGTWKGPITLNGPAIFNFLFDSQTIGGVVSGPGGITTAGVAGKAFTFTNVCTYAGDTTIGVGTLALSGGGALPNTASITIGSGANLDVSAPATALTLSAGQSLKVSATGANAAATCTVSSAKNLTLGQGLIFTAYGGGATAPLTIAGTGGALVLNGTPVTVVTTTPLAIGAYKLVSTNGATTATGTPGVLTVAGSGLVSGGTGALRITAGELWLDVVSGVPTYTVTYNGNGNTGGTVPADGSSPYTNGATVTVLDNTGSLTKTGYTFAGWNTAADGSATNYSPGATFSITNNTTLYAQWTINSYTLAYNGNSNDAGSAPASVTQNYNTTTTVAGAGSLAKTGYGFAGWNTAANGSGISYAAGSTFTFTTNTTLYAQWVSLATPVISTAGSLSAVDTTYGTPSAAPASFSVAGTNLNAGITVTPPPGFEVSQTSSTSGYAGSGKAITVGSLGNINPTTIYVRLAATAPVAGSPYSGNIVCASSGAVSVNVATASSAVSPAVASVTAIANSKNYGDPNPTLTASVVGAMNGDALNYTLATDATQYSAIGVSNITVSLGSNPNYTVSATNSTLTISPKAASLTADAKSKIYGDPNPPLTATVVGQVAGGDVINYTLATDATQYSAVGVSNITVTLGSNPNYTVSVTNSTLTINPVPIALPATYTNGLYIRAIPAKTVVLTFDDGCLSDYTNIAPILTNFGFGGSFYITEFTSTGNAFTNKDWYMTWQQISNLNVMGLEVGNHSTSHGYFGIQGLGGDRSQLLGLENDLLSNGTPKTTTFAWPVYSVNTNFYDCLFNTGYLFARGGGSGNERAYQPTVDSPYNIPSWTINDGSTNSAGINNFYTAITNATAGRVVVFTFHGVPDWEHPNVSLDPAKFVPMMQYLKDGNYNVIALRDLGKYIGRVNVQLTNTPVDGVTASPAVIHADFRCAGLTNTVFACWNTVNGGSNPDFWTNVALIGTWTNASSGKFAYAGGNNWADAGIFTNMALTNLSCQVTGLLANTTYYYTFFASNEWGSVWASNVSSFQLGVPSVDTAPGATNTAVTTTQLRGTLSGGVADIYFYWGTADGGTTPANWANTNVLTGANLGAFAASINVSNVLYGLPCYYRCFASNSFGTAWSPVTASFTTMKPVAAPPVIANAGFETPVVATGTRQALPSGASWTFVGNNETGIDANSGVFWYPTFASEGRQAAYLLANVALITVSQTLNFASPGNYTVNFDAIGRNNGAGPAQLSVQIDGTNVLFIPSGALPIYNWSNCITPPFYVSAGAHTLTFSCTNSTKASSIDNVRIDGAGVLITLTNSGSSAVTPTSASVSAALACPSAVYTPIVFWNTINGGTNAALWANSATLGACTNQSAANLVATLTGLAPGQTYYFTFAATNTAEFLWATNVNTFTTLAPPPPTLSNVAQVGGNLVLVWAGGTNQSCVLLSATNLNQPRSTWTPVLTNVVGPSGYSTNTVPVGRGEPQRYYLLSVPYN